jgi:predicted nucleotidyltransferase
MTKRISQSESMAQARRGALLAAVRTHRGGVTIYGLAADLGRPYRRVFEAVKRLAAEGVVRVESAVLKNRRVVLVLPAPGRGGSEELLPAHLSELERMVLRAIVARLRELDSRVVSLELFGSRARGDSSWDSDLDLAVRVRGRRDASLERRIIAAFADVEWSAPLEGALRISPLVLFEGERRAAIESVIGIEGVPVWKTRG